MVLVAVKIGLINLDLINMFKIILIIIIAVAFFLWGFNSGYKSKYN